MFFLLGGGGGGGGPYLGCMINQGYMTIFLSKFMQFMILYKRVSL